MSVNVPNPGLFLQQLGNDAVTFREALNALLRDAAYLNTMGGAAFLQAAPFNLTIADATQIMNTVGTVVPTNGVVVSVQNFINSTQFIWGGQ